MIDSMILYHNYNLLFFITALYMIYCSYPLIGYAGFIPAFLLIPASCDSFLIVQSCLTTVRAQKCYSELQLHEPASLARKCPQKVTT